MVQRLPGFPHSRELDAGLFLNEVREVLNCETLPRDEMYRTLAGLALNLLGKFPAAANNSPWKGYRFEVVSLDGRRINQIRVRLTSTTPPQ